MGGLVPGAGCGFRWARPWGKAVHEFFPRINEWTMCKWESFRAGGLVHFDKLSATPGRILNFGNRVRVLHQRADAFGTDFGAAGHVFGGAAFRAGNYLTTAFIFFSGMAEINARKALFTSADVVKTFAMSGSTMTINGSFFIRGAKRFGLAFV